jgi:hypothetical protein
LENTGHIFSADVVVTHPPFDDDDVIVNKDVALDVAVEGKKYKRYMNNYSTLKKEDAIPLAFDSYGGHASVTY